MRPATGHPTSVRIGSRIDQPQQTSTPQRRNGRSDMYEMYPEWGPSRHREDDQPLSSTAASLAGVQSGLDLRDNGGQRPDDN